jgi:hypothetical protein
VGRRRIADLEDAVNDKRIETGRRVRASGGARVKHRLIVGGSVAEAMAPFLDPTEGALGGVGKILKRPIGLGAQQGAQEHAVGKVVGFGVHLATSLGEAPGWCRAGGGDHPGLQVYEMTTMEGHED